MALSKQTPAAGPRPRVHPALNGATVVVGGAAGRAYRLVPAARHLAASPCGTVAVWWPVGAAAQPQVLVAGRQTQNFTLRLRGPRCRARWGKV